LLGLKKKKSEEAVFNARYNSRYRIVNY